MHTARSRTAPLRALVGLVAQPNGAARHIHGSAVRAADLRIQNTCGILKVVTLDGTVIARELRRLSTSQLIIGLVVERLK